MEIVLAIDNVVFIAGLTGRLPEAQRALARRLGLALALLMRVGLLFTISWVLGFTTPLFSILARPLSWLSLLGGGLFLVAKAMGNLPQARDTQRRGDVGGAAPSSECWRRSLLLDVVFSLGSMITAVGMPDQVAVMVVAMSHAAPASWYSREAEPARSPRTMHSTGSGSALRFRTACRWP